MHVLYYYCTGGGSHSRSKHVTQALYLYELTFLRVNVYSGKVNPPMECTNTSWFLSFFFGPLCWNVLLPLTVRWLQ